MSTHSRLTAVLTETFCALLIMAGLAFGPSAAQAQTYTVLSAIPGGSGISNPQGQAIALGRDGNLYTTSIGGGAIGNGTFFKFTPSGTTTLFTSIGDYAQSGVTLGTAGNFYGTNLDGGPGGNCGFSGCGRSSQSNRGWRCVSWSPYCKGGRVAGASDLGWRR